MREKTIEQYLIDSVETLGGKIVKLTCPGEAGNPDRLLKVPGFPAALCELKAPSKEPTALQRHRAQEWAAVGMLAGWAANHPQVDAFLARVLAQPRCA